MPHISGWINHIRRGMNETRYRAALHTGCRRPLIHLPTVEDMLRHGCHSGPCGNALLNHSAFMAMAALATDGAAPIFLNRTMASVVGRGTLLHHGVVHNVYALAAADASAAGHDAANVVLRSLHNLTALAHSPTGTSLIFCGGSLPLPATLWMDAVLSEQVVGPRVHAQWLSHELTGHELRCASDVAIPSNRTVQLYSLVERFETNLAAALHANSSLRLEGVEAQLLTLVQRATGLGLALGDLKGSNVLLTRTPTGWNARLSDFDPPYTALALGLPHGCRELFSLAKLQAQLMCSRVPRGAPAIAARVERLAERHADCAAVIFNSSSGGASDGAWDHGLDELRQLVLNLPCTLRSKPYRACVLRADGVYRVRAQDARMLPSLGGGGGEVLHSLAVTGGAV